MGVFRDGFQEVGEDKLGNWVRGWVVGEVPWYSHFLGCLPSRFYVCFTTGIVLLEKSGVVFQLLLEINKLEIETTLKIGW